MQRSTILTMLLLAGALACSSTQGTAPPPDGWANSAPTSVEQVVDRGDVQLLEVRQGELRAWVQVPNVGTRVGDYVLLGQGSARNDVEISEIGERVAQVVDIQHVRVADQATAERTVRSTRPAEADSIGDVYAQLAQRADKQIVVHGTVVKASSAVGWYWVHLRDGTGSAADGTHDLTVKTQQPVAEGQRATYRGTLRRDVDLGFGYRYAALVEEGVRE